MKKYPFFLIFAALYPVLSLYALNLSEVNLMYIIRPMIIGLICMGLLFGIFLLIFRNSQIGALASTVFYLVFCSYGALYNVSEGLSIGGFIVGRHRILLPIVIILTAIILWLVITRMRSPSPQIIQGINFVTGLLILFIVVQIGLQYNKISLPLKATSNGVTLPTEYSDNKPDVYYFILDSYPRADYIQKEMDYDNYPFIKALEQRGFYIGECSLSNYSMTRLSLTSSMNMDYIKELGITGSLTDDKDATNVDPYILHPRIRSDFEKAGYLTVAFETGFPLTTWSDADYLFRPDRNTLTMPVLTSFEMMLLQNTGLKTALDNQGIRRSLGFTFPYFEKWDREHYIIDQVKNIPAIPGQKLVFIHLVTTHRPYIFGSDGSILRDESYYRKDGSPINEDFYIRGFQYQLEYTNDYMLDLIDSIIQNTKIPPVIIIQGDHGVRVPGRFSILNALLIPNLKGRLYPSISPVNTFRVVENSVLGTNLELLPDQSYFSKYITLFNLLPVEIDDPCKIH